MPRYFMHLAYRGAPFHGWQVQPGEVTVQSVLENALSTILRQPTPVTGAGRTDAGVNAAMMVAHFDAPRRVDTRGVNSLVGRDIAVYAINEVHDGAHARFDATSRTGKPLDYEAMNRAAEQLLNTRDFTSFAKLHSDTRTNICNVTRAEWVADPLTGGMTFVITADRFLRNMVRAVVGTLVDVGRGKLSAEGFREVIESRDRCAAGTSMPPEALYLQEITYPYWKPERHA